MADAFARTEMLFGKDAMNKLADSRVAVFGLGGVGGYAVEALARSGVGALDLIDHDTVSLTNINRQILATKKTVGKHKTEVAKERIADINPDCNVTEHRVFFLPETAARFDFSVFDYVVDAIDTVTGKLLLAESAKAAGVPIISAMGTGNQTDPTALYVTDLFATRNCPLARIMRKECRKRGIDALKVVCSKEKPSRPVQAAAETPENGRRDIPGSAAFVPSAAGLILAGEVVKDLIGFQKGEG